MPFCEATAKLVGRDALYARPVLPSACRLYSAGHHVHPGAGAAQQGGVVESLAVQKKWGKIISHDIEFIFICLKNKSGYVIFKNRNTPFMQKEEIAICLKA